MIDTYYLMIMGVTLAWIHGFEYAFKPEEILGKVGDWGRSNLPDWITKPTFNCAYCMASVHGTAFFLMFLWGYPVYLWIIFVVCLTGLTALIKN
jgi:hypothetical protein